jgi:hypothetical protein
MKNRDSVVLLARRVVFKSPSDEAVFFEWLDRLPCVSHYEGKGDSLHIEINSESVDEPALRELLAMFHRYDIDKKQLIAFDREEFSPWFRDERKYWFSGVFGTSSRRPRRTSS